MRPLRPGPGLLIFAAALALRLGWVLLRWGQVGPTLEFPDEELHWQLARNVVSTGTLVSDDGRHAARMPLYPLFLVPFAGLGERGILLARLAQAVLGAGAVVLVCRLAAAAAGKLPGLLAGLLAAFDPFAIFFCNLLLTEVLFSLWALALTVCAWQTLAAPRPDDTVSADGPFRCSPAAAGLGVALFSAAALLTRPSAAGWIVLLWLLVTLLDRQRRRALRRLGLCLLVTGLALLPWGLRNRAVLGAPAWLSTNGGVSLYDALGLQADGSSNQAFVEHLPELTGLGEVERDRVLRRLALAELRTDPKRALRLAWRKFLRTWSLRPNVASYRGGLTGLVSATFTAAVLLAGLAGLLRALAARRPSGPGLRRLHVLLWLPVVYFTLLHCVFVGSLRYRVPLMPFVELAAATAFVRPVRSQADAE